VKWDSTYDKNFEGHEKVFRMENNWMMDFSILVSAGLLSN
jgi:hypothetical protein